MPKIQLVEPVGVLSSPTIDHWNHSHTGGEHNYHHFSELIQQYLFERYVQARIGCALFVRRADSRRLAL